MEVTEKLKVVGMGMASDATTRLSGKAGEQSSKEDYVDMELTQTIMEDWPQCLNTQRK